MTPQTLKHGLQVPTLCISTVTETLFSFVSAPAMYIKRIYGVDSDGLVVTKDSILEKSFVVRPEGDIHHLAPVMPSPPWGYVVKIPAMLWNACASCGNQYGGAQLKGRYKDEIVCDAKQASHHHNGDALGISVCVVPKHHVVSARVVMRCMQDVFFPHRPTWCP